MSELNLHGIAMASYEESNAFVSREAMVGKKIESLETSVEEVVESDSVQDQTLAEVEVVNEEQSSDIKGMEEMIASNANAIKGHEDILNDLNASVDSLAKQVDVLTIQGSEILEEMGALKDGVTIEFKDEMEAEVIARMEGDASLNARVDAFDGEISSFESVIENEVIRATNAENEAKNMIYEEMSLREAADTELTNKLANEAEARKAVEEALRVNAEVIASNSKAINDISSVINSNSDAVIIEATARMEGDISLNEAIASESTARMEGDASLNEALAKEASARMESDRDFDLRISEIVSANDIFKSSIDIESTTRETSDNELSSKINDLQAALNKEVLDRQREVSSAINSAITVDRHVENEANLRASADDELRNIDAELMAMDEQINASMEAEEEARKAADEAMNAAVKANALAIASNVEAIGDNATAIKANSEAIAANAEAIVVLNEAVAAETAARTLFVSNLQDEMDEEVSLRNEADTELRALIEAMELRIKALEEMMNSGDNTLEDEEPIEEIWYEPVVRLVNQTYGSTSLNYGIDTVIRLEVEQRSSLGNVRTSVNGDFEEPVIFWSVREPLRQTYQTNWEIGVRNENINDCPSTASYIEARWEYDGGSYWSSMTLDCWC